MLDIIRLLPESLANQIAAGEVVQRPASVVKEMLENSVDAEATTIELVLKDAGKILIQVIDNGKGMSETDARMCFERHATSKIIEPDDLYNILTFGFRGEAMASVAAVAQVELRTKQEDQEIGTFIYIEGSEVKKHEPIATQKGTSLAVKNLFFNTPARRKFLKSNSVELRHITQEFERVALANPHINFSMHHNGQEIYNLREGKLARRIVAMFGKSYQSNLLTCQEDVETIKLLGYVGKPQAAKKTKGSQYFFVNNRFIKSGYLHHAVMTAYEGLLPKDAHPFYVLFIEIDPKKIDINVHPTKTEIKFDDERTVYVVVQSAVKQALGVSQVVSPLDFDTDANFLNPSNYSKNQNENYVVDENNDDEPKTFFSDFSKYDDKKTNENKDFIGKYDKDENKGTYGSYINEPFNRKKDLKSHERPEPTERQKSNQKNWERIYLSDEDMEASGERRGTSNEGVNRDKGQVNTDYNTPRPSSHASRPQVFRSSANNLSKVELEAEIKSSKSKIVNSHKRHVFWVANRFVASPTKSGMILIDASAAHERILYERYEQRIAKSTNNIATSQQILFPPTLTFSVVDYELLKEVLHELKNLGFSIEINDKLEEKQQIRLIGLPADLLKEKGESILEALLEQFKYNQTTIKIPKRENILRAFAKRASMQTKNYFSTEEMQSLIDELFACQQPNYTPDGKKIFMLLDTEMIEQLFL
ncbi:DNA mismatch repair protein MutL [Bernardetia litoralis DSM 6794]|uniref:DNA mismatch repair protein MutL n=1 Tax=Bernardetia litoralis (strain ATCC 23117 / DSM 6794 / NBRC 15988 / NCIMB 1366 / Fx l1 / Sio-4) TaxID=880071 RepID=I4AGJ1_BERLS|nr:DNA mismatch repair endonuclease MutL [Bernardetia litoralis]AFM03076.1 DNA mismatch repair protein MutL [Bernardetia litoralis DSM 6794]